MANPCVKTGARVLVVEYGGVAPADLFLVGNAIVARFGTGTKTELRHDELALEHATHRMTLGTAGWWKPDLAIAVVPIDQLEGDLVHPYHGRPMASAKIAARFRPAKVLCLACEGSRELVERHPTGNPELERPYECPECDANGEIEVTQEVAELLERKAHQRDRVERCLASILHAHRELADVLAPVRAALQELPR